MSNVISMHDWETRQDYADSILMITSTLSNQDGWVKVTTPDRLDILVMHMLDAPFDVEVNIESPAQLPEGATLDDIHSVIKGISCDSAQHGWFKVNAESCRAAIRHAVDLKVNTIDDQEFDSEIHS